MFKKNDTPIAIYQDDYKPAKLMYNGMKVAGYSENEFRDSHIGVRHTYNDNLNCVLEGRHTQDTKYLIKWNQLVPDEEAVETVSDGIIQQGASIRTVKLSCKKNHIYFWHVQSKASENYPTKTQFRWFVYNSTSKTTLSGGYFYKRGEYETVTIRFQTTSDCLVHLQCARNEYPVAEQEINPITLSTKNSYLLDLTEMFGDGLAPDLETCRKIFPCEYYPYNAGEMMPMPKGAMVNFNQLVAGLTGYKNDLANVDDYIRWEINGQYSDAAYNPITVVPKIPRVGGDKYFTSVKLRGTANGRYGFRVIAPGAGPDMSVVTLPSDEWLCKSQLGVVNGTYSNIMFGNTRGDITEETTGVYVDVKDMVIINLTKMFGPGNEPSTVEEFKALFPEDYYEYVETRVEPTIGFYEDGKIVENGLVSKYKENNYCENPCDVVPVTNPKLEIKRKLYWNQLIPVQAVSMNKVSNAFKYIGGHLTFKYSLPNHIYYVHSKFTFVDASNVEYIYLDLRKNNGGVTIQGTGLRMSLIDTDTLEGVVSASTDRVETIYFRALTNEPDVNIDMTVTDIVLVDLTKMFGAGNEPTLEEFKSMFPEDYYPYDEGHYISEYPVSSASYEFPYGDLYGDGEVNDTVEPRVMVDGEWKCRVTRRWRKFYLKDAASLQMYTYRATPEGLLEQVETRYNVTRGVCVSIFIKVSGTVGFDLLKGVSGTKVYSNIFNAYPNIYTILPLEGSKHGHIAIHPNDAQYPWHFYASLSYNELGIPNDVDISDWTELRTYFNAWVERYITNASEENAPYILYQVQNPVVELYDPLPQMKTYPVNTFIDSEAIINTKIKTVDLK